MKKDMALKKGISDKRNVVDSKLPDFFNKNFITFGRFHAMRKLNFAYRKCFVSSDLSGFDFKQCQTLSPLSLVEYSILVSSINYQPAWNNAKILFNGLCYTATFCRKFDRLFSCDNNWRRWTKQHGTNFSPQRSRRQCLDTRTCSYPGKPRREKP